MLDRLRRTPRARTGRRGERLAARYLRRRGYRVIDRNVRLTQGEIDLVCLDPDRRGIVVVEVRTRHDPGRPARAYDSPESSVGPDKRRKLLSLTRSLVRANGWEGRPVRIDLVAVVLGAGKPVIRHHVDAVR